MALVKPFPWLFRTVISRLLQLLSRMTFLNQDFIDNNPQMTSLPVSGAELASYLRSLKSVVHWILSALLWQISTSM